MFNVNHMKTATLLLKVERTLCPTFSDL